MLFKNIFSVYQTRTLTRDLSLILSLTMAIVLIIVGALYYTVSVTQTEQDLDKRANETADNLADVLSLPLWELDSASINQIADAYLQSEDVVALQVIDDQDEIIYQQSTSADNIISETRPIFFQDRQLGYIEISFSTQTIDSLRKNIFITLFSVLFALVATVIIVTRILLQRFLKTPLENLTQGMDIIAEGNYQYRMPSVNLVDIQAINDQVNFMASQIEERDRNLEKQVAARTHDLQVAVDVSRQITIELEIDKLLNQIVQLTTERFQLYACFIFQFDKEQNVLRQLAGASADGQKIEIAEKISVNAEPSVIALAARTREFVTVNDVQKSEIYMSHETLEETRAELAIPMLIGGKLLGVFDLQSRVPNRFSKEDLRILTALAEQVAIAIRNAQLFHDAEQARHDAEEANRVKSQFLANMSHELRTPLNAILNFTGFVADGDLGPVNEKQEDVLLRAVSSGEHLLNLINDILDMTKIEVGMMNLFIREVNINDVLKSAAAVATGLLKDKSAYLIEDIEEDLPTIQGDKRRLHQVFLNILSNANKFTPQGTITIKAQYIDAKILVSIIDTGIGIPADDQPFVFDRFKQAKHDLDIGGTGLGMPITKHFVEAHDGKIWFESELGKGTTFFVELPVKAEIEVKSTVIPQEELKK